MASPSQNSPDQSLNFGAPPAAAGKKKVLGAIKGYTPPSVMGAQYPPQTPPVPGAVLPVGLTTSQGAPYNELNYTAADVMAPGADLNGIPQLQAEMIAAGILPKNSARPGVWDAATQTAYARVLTFANHNGMNAQDAMTYLVANPTLGALKAANGPAGPTVAFTNPIDVQQTYQNESQQLTGQQQQSPQFQSYYHGLEAQQQHGIGQDYTQAPTVADAADSYLQKNDPSQIQAYGAASRMLELESMLGVK